VYTADDEANATDVVAAALAMVRGALAVLVA
jgi:hypothetical protein